MAESPIGYFPDVGIQYNAVLSTLFGTVVDTDPHTGAEQRATHSPSSGRRMWRGQSVSMLSYAQRREVSAFLNRMRGQYSSFYFFAPDPSEFELVSLGTASSQATLIVPFKTVSASGVVIGEWREVRVGTSPQVVKDFTTRALLPREGTYAALRINATTQHVDCGSNASLRTLGSQSIFAWVNVFALNAGSLNTICENETADASGILFGIDSNRYPFFRTNQAGAHVDATGTTAITYGSWVHVGVVKSGTDVTFYVNGAAAGTASSVTNPIVSTKSFKLSSNIGSNTALNGLLSEVRYYDTDVSAGEVALIYAGNAPANANLKGHWKVSEGYGTSAADTSGYGNTGTLTNSPTWVGGEDEITFTAGAQTGAVVGRMVARPRVIARSLRDDVTQALLPRISDVRTVFPLEILELVS